MNAVKLLRRDHDAVRDLFLAFRNAGDVAAARGALFAQIEEQLRIHTAIEEEIFYPACADADAERTGVRLIVEATQEHEEVKERLRELASADPASDEFPLRVRQLQDLVDAHVAEEERILFDFAFERLGAQRLAELGDELAARKRELGERSPKSPVR
jgi:iron-sulfur cluster repair protein YtfE (RIC family)